MPKVVSSPIANLRSDPKAGPARFAVEFESATPLEYLSRWMSANEVFGDDIHLASVVEWSDGRISFGITQPQYNGTPASHDEIERYFLAAGWSRIPDASGHSVFYNYAFEVLAIDALPRNCYINAGLLLPFDVILCQPDKTLTEFLSLYPD